MSPAIATWDAKGKQCLSYLWILEIANVHAWGLDGGSVDSLADDDSDILQRVTQLHDYRGVPSKEQLRFLFHC